MHSNVELSILIPTFNDECFGLVKSLSEQLSATHNVSWEIIVADDGSTNQGVISLNRSINELDNCNYIERKDNIGRAAIRNYLAQKASFDTLLYIDSDMAIISSDFIAKYIAIEGDVVYGGYKVVEENYSLRYRYEKSCENIHIAEKRNIKPYDDFHTSNFLIKRSLMLKYPFDESFRNYGYEDVYFGKQLKQAGIKIRHIDNPVGFCRFETDEEFINKTDEATATLLAHREELNRFSRLLAVRQKMEKWHVRGLFALISKTLAPSIRRRLCHEGAPLWLLRIYKFLKVAD